VLLRQGGHFFSAKVWYAATFDFDIGITKLSMYFSEAAKGIFSAILESGDRPSMCILKFRRQNYKTSSTRQHGVSCNVRM